MSTAFGRLWRRAPVWRAALLLALPASLLTALYPPRPGLWRPGPVSAAVTVQRPPPVDPAPATPETRTAEPAMPGAGVVAQANARPNRLALLDTYFPFYRRGDSDLGLPDQTVIEEEATHRPVYSGTVPFQHREIALPSGNWTVVAVVPEKMLDDGPASMGLLLARLDGHRVTGLTMIRGSDAAKPGTLQTLPPNPYCDTTARHARWRAAAPADGRDACWFIALETSPDQLWDAGGAPPAAQIGLATMHLTEERIPETMLGVTVFHLDGARWLEITSWFDPSRNGVAPAKGMIRGIEQAATDPAMTAMITRMRRWTGRRMPLPLSHPILLMCVRA